MVSVDVHASSGVPARRQEFRRPCTAAFLLYTEGLHACPTRIAATVSWTRVFVDVDPLPGYGPADYPLVNAEEPPDGFGFGEDVHALVDGSILLAPADARPMLSLNWLHRTLLAVARTRHWDEEPLHFAYRHAVRSGGVGVFVGPTKAGPDRRHRATVTLLVDADGDATLRIDAVDRAGVPVAGAARHVDGVFPEEWRRLRAHFRWTSARAVGTGDRDPLDRRPSGWTGRLALDLDAPGASPLVPIPEIVPAQRLSADEVAAIRPAAVRYPPTITTDLPADAPPTTTAREIAMLSWIAPLVLDPRWSAWWNGAGRRMLRIRWNDAPAGALTGISLSDVKQGDLRVMISRGRRDGDPDAAAAADVAAAVTAVRERFVLSEPPPLEPFRSWQS
jgi:hypothetical protein